MTAAADRSPARILRDYIWSEPAAAAPAGTALARVRRGQLQVALIGSALWLASLTPAVLAVPGQLGWCLALAIGAGVVTLVGGLRESWLLTGVLTVTASIVLLTTDSHAPGAVWPTEWFDAAAISALGMATLRRALVALGAVTLGTLGSWLALLPGEPDLVGWRSVVVWPLATATVGLTAAILAAVVRAGARRLDDTVASAQQAISAEEVVIAEREQHQQTARLLHDTVINTLTAIGRGVADGGLVALRARCRQDVALIDRTTESGGGDADPLSGVRGRAEALQLRLTVQGSGQQLLHVPPVVREAALAAVGEALVNVGKHAGTADVLLSLTEQQDAVVVEVSDRGRGWSGEIPDGRGIADSIQARCAAAGIAVTVTSHPGNGSSVSLTLPIEHLPGDDPSPAVFVEESRIMAAVVCVVLMTDIAVRSVLTIGLAPAWRALTAFVLLSAALAWGWVAARGRPRPTSVPSLVLALVSLPVLVLLPPLTGPSAWAWWGSLAGITIFLAFIAINASAWWLAVAFVAQLVGRAVSLQPTVFAAITDAVVLAIGAGVAVAIRAKVLTLMDDTAAAAQSRDEIRGEVLQGAARNQQSVRRLQQASDRARLPLDRIASGQWRGDEPAATAAARELAPYLRNYARIGPELGALGEVLAELLDAALDRGRSVQLTIGPRVPEPPRRITDQLQRLLATLPATAVDDIAATVTLTRTPSGRGQLTVLLPDPAAASQSAPQAVPGVVALRSAGAEVVVTPADARVLLEIRWSAAPSETPVGQSVPAAVP